jgi:putative transposase
VVDTTGLVIGAVVHSAALTDRVGGRLVLAAAKIVSEPLQLIWADMGYRGQPLKEWIEKECKWQLEIVKRPSRWGRYPVDVEPPEMPAFSVLLRRWGVERSFAWMGRYRRMSKGYEYLIESSEAMVYLAMSRLMLKRLVRRAPNGVPSPQRLGLTGSARAF